MKIAMVFDGLRIGGIERVGIDYIRLFQELGYEVAVFNLRPKLTEMEKELPSGTAVFHVNYPRYFAPERYAATLKGTSWGKFVYPIAFSMMKLMGVVYRPLVRMAKKEMREEYDFTIAFSGHINDLTFIADGYLRGKQKLAWVHGAEYEYMLMSPGYFRLYQKIRNLVSLSDLCDVECLTLNQKNGIRKATVYNPIFMQERNIDEQKVAELNQVYGDFCVMVARLEDDKDHKTAIRAMRILRDRYGLKKRILFVGGGKNLNLLKEYAKEQGVEDQTVFVGAVSDVQNYYAAAHICVHSSPLEGLPTVLLEAMTFDLPIAATDSVPGVREILGNQECGLISDVFDADGLAEHIYRLYTEEALRDELILSGRKRLSDFSPKTIRDKIASYFDALQNMNLSL